MAHLRFGVPVSGLARESARAPVVRTPAGFLKRLGRALLWLVVLVLLLRGIAGVFDSGEPRAVVRQSPRPVVVWPDDEARAFAADFARVYLGYSGRDPRGLQAFVAPELASSIAPELPRKAPRQVVGAVNVARTAVLGPGRALVTVAATVNGQTRYLAVPVARDGDGGLVVFDLPSFVAPPARARFESDSPEPVALGEQAAMEDVLTRFFRAYLAGDARELEYLVPPGVRMGALAQREELVDLESLALGAPAKGRTREVLATVRARDLQTKAVFALRYRVRVVRRDRWLVAAVNTTTRRRVE